MDTILQDMRYALRTLVRARGFTAAAVSTLGIGIGATALIFSMVNSILLRPFPFSEPERLVWLEEQDRTEGTTGLNTSYPTYLEWRTQATSYSGMGVVDEGSAAVRFGQDAERLPAGTVSAGLFGVLGVRPQLGRDFLPDEEGVGAPPAVIVSHRLWQERFAGARDVIGRTIHVNTVARTVVGVMPAGFAFPERSELWLPVALDPVEGRGTHFLNTIARLRTGVTVAEANRELATISARLAAQYPDANGDMLASAQGLQDATVREVRPVLLILLGATGFVLLIACANVANLLLSRAATRDREIAIRGALGAGGGRLLRMLLTESLVLAALGAGLGVLLSMWWLDLLVRALPADMPYWLTFEIDGTVLAFVAATATLTAVFCGLAPAWQAMRTDMQRALKESGRSATAGRARTRLRSAFVVTQMAGAVVLLAGALLMVKSFLAMREVDPGFERSGLVTVRVDLPEVRYDTDPSITGFYDRLLERVRAIPGVEQAAVTGWFPVSGRVIRSNFSIAGVGEIETHSAHNLSVSPDYFATMGIRLLRGRAFTAQDRAEAAPVAIINRALAERFFPGQDPLGRGIKFGGAEDATPADYATIVGIVENVNQADVNQSAIGPDIYMPHAQAAWAAANLVLRTRGELSSLLEAVRREVRAIDPDVPLFETQRVEDVLRDATWDSRLYTVLFALFAAGALLLAAIGLYAVIAFSVTQRRHEIGVRVALGASVRGVAGLVLGQGVRLLAIGLVIGLGLALLVSSTLEKLLFGVRATDPLTFLLVPTLLTAVALLACWLPVRRATRVDPIVALRSE